MAAYSPQEVRQALENWGVDVNHLEEIQLCRSPTWKEQVEMRLAGNEPDHQTMFLHFSNYESKEHGKSVLGGQWIAGISKQNNMKRNCAEHKHFHFLLCLFLVHPIWSMF